jgi:membrane-bound lytic murein transglycosylase B
MLVGSDMARAEPVGPPAGSVAVFIDEAAQLFDIPASWIRAVMRAESSGDAHARSPKGAMGLMQIMPQTWAALRSRYGLGADPYDTHDNILAGAAYLRELHDRYGSPGFLAAYNAGPARYEDHLATGRPLPAETRAYVAAVAPLIDSEAIDGTMVVSAAAPFWTGAPLFAVRAEGNSTKSEAASTGQPATDNAATDRTVLAPQAGGLFVSIHAGSERVP